MEITRLGRTGLKVSRLCLGTMNFGPRTSEDDAHEIMDRAVEGGISFFDTADIYGPDGLTEEIVGRWLAKDGRRDQIVLATKLFRPMGPGANDGGLSARHIVRACDVSLRRPHRDQIEQWEDFCAGFGAEPAQIATAWLLHQPAVTAPIVGPGTVAHLETALRAAELTLDSSALARLDEIWLGPGAAPESYAW